MGKDGLLRTNVPVPANLSSGYTKIELTATDRFGRAVTFNEYVFIQQTDPAIPADYSRTDAWFEWIRPNEADGKIVFENSDEVLIGLANERLLSAAVKGTGADNLIVDVDEYGRAVLQAKNEGMFGPFTLNVTTVSDAVFESGPFSVIADFTAPRVTVYEMPKIWLQREVPVQFNLAASNQITSVEYSLDMGESWQELLTGSEVSGLRAPVNANFTRTIDISDFEDGAVTILIRAANVIERHGYGLHGVKRHRGSRSGTHHAHSRRERERNHPHGFHGQGDRGPRRGNV